MSGTAGMLIGTRGLITPRSLLEGLLAVIITMGIIFIVFLVGYLISKSKSKRSLKNE